MALGTLRLKLSLKLKPQSVAGGSRLHGRMEARVAATKLITSGLRSQCTISRSNPEAYYHCVLLSHEVRIELRLITSGVVDLQAMSCRTLIARVQSMPFSHALMAAFQLTATSVIERCTIS